MKAIFSVFLIAMFQAVPASAGEVPLVEFRTQPSWEQDSGLDVRMSAPSQDLDQRISLATPLGMSALTDDDGALVGLRFTPAGDRSDSAFDVPLSALKSRKGVSFRATFHGVGLVPLKLSAGGFGAENRGVLKLRYLDSILVPFLYSSAELSIAREDGQWFVRIPSGHGRSLRTTAVLIRTTATGIAGFFPLD